MLYDLSWMEPGKPYPPLSERDRITRYVQNAALFDNEQFSDNKFRHRNITAPGVLSYTCGLYDNCAERISKVVGNFNDIISVPVLLNYQRFMSLKMADLVAGEHPLITGKDAAENAKIKWILDNTNFYEKLYSIVIDMSRFGDCPIRIYKNPATDFYDFTLWEAPMWQPIVSKDGTNTITHHVLSWVENKNPDTDAPDYYLHFQIYEVAQPNAIEERVYYCGSNLGVIGQPVAEQTRRVTTGFEQCPVFSLRAFAVSGTVYGYDDYVPLDAIMTEIIARVSQISAILDKHADPSMTGPVSMLRKDTKTGEYYLEASKFYGINEGDTPPQYLTWDGQLEAAFKQLEFLINQLYILSEMGAALTGGIGENSNAVSGTAMRFKLVNPLAKARRVSNSLTLPIRKLLSVLGSNMPEIDEETAEPGNGPDTPLPFGHISIDWQDGLPNDPREQIEMCKLASGETKMLPLEDALMQFMSKSQAEATELVQKLRETALQDQTDAINNAAEMAKAQAAGAQPSGNSTAQPSGQQDNPNKPGPQDGKGVNPNKKGSKTGISNFQAENNKSSKEK